MRVARITSLMAAGMAAALVAGCHVESTKNGDGKNVNISTPFGGMQVKTNDAEALTQIGLPGYPGAVPAKKTNGNDDNDSADVNMNFGGFHMRVNAASYRTDDAPDKVEAFFRSGMKRYGDVIACRNHAPIGQHARTAEGLTCDNNHGGHISVGDNENCHTLELRAGSQQHQHMVTIDPDGGGAKFTLVALELPGRDGFDGGNDDTRQ